MKKIIIIALAFAAALPAARGLNAAPPSDDKVFAAMKDEMARSMAKLNMDNLGKPYFLSYHIGDGHSFSVTADFGAVENLNSSDYRRLKVDLRTGTPRFDNSNYAPNMWEGYRAETDWNIALDDNYDALRFAVWSATDKAYKKALETLSKKRAFVESKNMTELYDDMTPQAPYELYRTFAVERLDEKLWGENIRRVSAVFLKYPEVKYSSVRLHFNSGGVRYLNSEGSANRRPSCDGDVTITASGYAPDGFRLKSSHVYDFCLAKDAPALETLLAKADEIGKNLARMSKSEPIKAYIGPVLFEKDAAGKFFETLLVNNVANPREVWTEKSRWSEETVYRRAGELVERIGMRVTSPFLNVVDDPTVRYHEGVPLSGFYEVDDEGVPAQKIKLVTKGKLSEYYMSRAATRDFNKSNGHGRGDFSEYPAGSPSNVFIIPEDNPAKVLPMPELKKKFLDLCKEQELDYCILVKGLDSLYGPFSAWKVYPDGREEPVHGIEFTGTSLRALRDITAVSKETYVYNLAWSTPGTIVTPSILVQEMEIKKTEEKPEKKPYLGHPYFAK
ncbi:MAG: metallopeptidase TldD-related protein [Elusimicrobiales bacterium]|nr:metallopeptidase TldD-related protein [Elusimicrobiales bacterium]